MRLVIIVAVRIFILDTAYWPILKARGLAGKPQKHQRIPAHSGEAGDKSESGSSYAFWLGEFGHECQHVVANARCPQLQSKTFKARSFLGSLSWSHWQIISRLPLIGPIIYRNSQLAKIFIRQVLDFRPDVLLVMNPNLLPKSVGKTFSKAGITVVGQIASPLPPASFFDHYDMMVSAHPSQVKYFQTLGIESRYLPLKMDNAAVPAESTHLVNRTLDITFVGSFGRHHKHSLELIRRVAEEFPSLQIFTVSPIRSLIKHGLGKNFAGQAWGKRMVEIYGDSKIVLNRHAKMANGYAVNYRMFEATAAGALLLTELAPNLPSLFEPDREVLTYDSAEEALFVIRKVLSDVDAWQDTASRGRERLMRDHLASNRTRQLEALLREAVSLRSTH